MRERTSHCRKTQRLARQLFSNTALILKDKLDQIKPWLALLSVILPSQGPRTSKGTHCMRSCGVIKYPSVQNGCPYQGKWTTGERKTNHWQTNHPIILQSSNLSQFVRGRILPLVSHRIVLCPPNERILNLKWMWVDWRVCSTSLAFPTFHFHQASRFMDP